VEGVTIAQVDEQRNIIEESKRYIPCDTLLLSVGLIPENELTRSAGIPMDPITGGAIVDEQRQTQIPGIFACGNVLQVHDLVDYVSDEAETAGADAAAFVNQSLSDAGKVATRPGKGVRYVLPQQVNVNRETDIPLFLRVSQPFGKVRFSVRSGEEELAKLTCLKAAPGEMVKINIPAARLALAKDHITVSLEELS